MYSDHGKYKDQENILHLKGNATPLIESRGRKCHASKNSTDSFTDISSISSFTHDSMQRRNTTSNVRDELKRNLHNKYRDVLQGIKNYDKLQTGKILPVNLYNVLRIFCFPLTLKEFNSLIKEEPVDENGYVSYRSFLSDMAPKENALKMFPLNEETRVDVASLNTEELEIKIKNKLSKNLKNFIRCMWLHDFNSDGFIQKEDLKTVIENLCFPLTDEQFSRFWNLYDPCNSGVINYTEFLLKLGTHTESYKRILPQNKRSNFSTPLSHNPKYSRQEQIQTLYAKLGRDDPEVQGQLFNHIVDVFKQRIKKEYPLLMRTLRIKDPRGSGFIPLSVFHQVLNFFVMPMSLQLFKEIIRSFNFSPNTTRIAWYLFLEKVCANGDVKGVAEQSSVKGSVLWKICKSVLEKLKRNGKNTENFFKHSFTISTPDHKKAVTRAELRKIINQSLLLPVSEEEFKALMFLLDPGHTNFVECEKFLCLFKLVHEDQENQNSKLPNDAFIENKNLNTNLSGEKLKTALKKCFNKNLKNIEKTLSLIMLSCYTSGHLEKENEKEFSISQVKCYDETPRKKKQKFFNCEIGAFYAFDSEESGTINMDDFRKILDVFCFPLTDNQFSEVADSFIMSNKVFYLDFINFNKKGPYEDEEKWKSCITKLASPQVIPKQKLNSEEVLSFVKEIINANRDSVLQDFKDHDVCNTRAVRREFFHKLLHKYVFRLTDDQFEFLWSKLPKNEIGFLKYEEFLDNWYLRPNSALQPEIKIPLSTRSNSIIFVSSKSSRSSNATKERPKTASSVLSTRSMSIASAVQMRPKSAASHHSISNLSTKSNSHLSVHSKDFENCGILTKEEYKQYKSINFPKKECFQRPSSRTSSTSNKFISKDLQRRTANLDELERIIQTRWRDILRRCKQLDSNNHDVIPYEDFIGILQRTGIHMDEDILKGLENKYRIKKNVPVNYWVFLKTVLLKFNMQQDTAASMKEWNPNNKSIPKPESVGLCKMLLNYRDKILKNYRDLYHAFRRVDRQHTGEISTLQFRKILTIYKIYMKDNDLFYIQDYFDPNLSEKIPYDKFLKSFVK